jgi:Ca2+-binding RTX toxin-like protein
MERRFISDLDVQVLQFGLGYEVTLPSLQPATVRLEQGVVTILGTDGDDMIGIDIKDEELIVVVNSLEESVRFQADQVTRIQVYAKRGNDHVTVSSSIEAPVGIDGGPGDDVLYGGSSNDTLLGATGDDVLHGRGGADQLAPGKGTDYLFGDSGDDQYWFEAFSGDDVVVEQANAGVDELNFSLLPSVLTLFVDLTNSLFPTQSEYVIARHLLGTVTTTRPSAGDFENVQGGQGRDFIVGNAADNYLAGNDGKDRIEGGDGNDTLIGGQGQDRLYGQGGDDYLDGGRDGARDLLVGGEGADTIVIPLVRYYHSFYITERFAVWIPSLGRFIYVSSPRRVDYSFLLPEDSFTDLTALDDFFGTYG